MYGSFSQKTSIRYRQNPDEDDIQSINFPIIKITLEMLKKLRLVFSRNNIFLPLFCDNKPNKARILLT